MALTRDARILRALREAAVHLLPGDLAAQCGTSLGEVESSIGGLQEAGFDIESKPGLGCRLISSPDRLIADDLHSRLGDCAVASEIVVFAETNSTNDVAANLGRQGHAGGVVVFAERQTAGRGRFGRRWVSADHEGLWFSLLLRPEMPLVEWPRLTTWAGVCVARAVGENARIKWPNDVLLGGRKVAGILIESVVDQCGRPFAVLGIGVNINQSEFPSELEDRATSLKIALGRKQDRTEFAASLLGELARTLPQVSREFPGILAEAERRSSVLGKWVKLHSGTTVCEGLAESLDGDGNLIIRGIDGIEARMSSGEISSREIIS